MIHRFTADEWQRARSIRLRALQDTPDAFGATYERDVAITEERWRSRLGSEESATFVALVDGKDVGLVAGAAYDSDAGLYSMWVAPEARGQGVGDALVEAVIAWARQRGHAKLYLDVGDENRAAIALYSRHGFEPTGHTGTLDPPRTHVLEHQRVLHL